MRLMKFTFLAIAATLAACKPETDSGALAQQDAGMTPAAREVREVIKELREHLRDLGPVISKRYVNADGTINNERIIACWQNPAGSRLTKWQKLLYCHYPLEFRLCYSPQLIDADTVHPILNPQERLNFLLDKYDECEAKISDQLFDEGEEDHYRFNKVHPRASAVFTSVYLQKTSPDRDDAAIEFLTELGMRDPDADSVSFLARFEFLNYELIQDAAYYPAFKETLADVLKAVPPALGAGIGNAVGSAGANAWFSVENWTREKARWARALFQGE